MTASLTLPAHEPVDGEEHMIDVDGAAIWYRVSGRLDGPTMILVHGNGANHWWWHSMLPALATRYRVVEMDLSAHGESGHRTSYSIQGWAEEIRAVATAVSNAPVALVGHSMGGMLCGIVAAQHPEVVDALMVLDSTFGPRDRDMDGPEPEARPQRYYPDLETVLGRFRLMPPQPQPPAEVLAPIARGSVHETPDGWTWKQDQTRRPSFDSALVEALPSAIRCPVTFVYGDLSDLVGEVNVEYMREHVTTDLTVAVIPEVRHHLMIEDPASCVEHVDAFMARRAAGGI